MAFKLPLNYQSIVALLMLSAFSLVGCSGSKNFATGATGGEAIGNIRVDGSSTVFPISEAMAEEFMKVNPEVRVTVGISGSGGGFKKFCAGETHITNASRPINSVEEKHCQKNGINYIEIPIAFDGISVVVNTENNFAYCLTVEEIKAIWEPEAQGKIENWRQIRASFPDRQLRLYGPGIDSGTYDYFTAAIVGEEGNSRGDYTASEDDNTLVWGVAADPGGLGFFGYAYYEENKDKLNLVGIDRGEGCIAPNAETIADGSYQPLSRPEFLYVNKSVADREDIKAFVEFHLAPENQYLISEVGYVSLSDRLLKKVRQRYEMGKTGSVFEGGSTVGIKLTDLLEIER